MIQDFKDHTGGMDRSRPEILLASLQTLLIFMAIDWFTGGFLLPAVFKKSPKSENGTLESRAGWKGLCRKGMTMLFVLIGARLDILVGTGYFRDAVCIAFIANEALSIIENAGLMGGKGRGDLGDRVWPTRPGSSARFLFFFLICLFA